MHAAASAAGQWPAIRTGHSARAAENQARDALPLSAQLATFCGLVTVLGVSLVAPLIAGQTRARYLVTHESLPDQVAAHLLALQARPNQTAPEGVGDVLRKVTALRANVAVPLFCSSAVWVIMAISVACSRTLLRGRTRQA